MHSAKDFYWSNGVKKEILAKRRFPGFSGFSKLTNFAFPAKNVIFQIQEIKFPQKYDFKRFSDSLLIKSFSSIFYYSIIWSCLYN